MGTNHAQQNTYPEYTQNCADFSTQTEERIYSDEELTNITELGDILQSIRKRLISEGLSIEELRVSLN